MKSVGVIVLFLICVVCAFAQKESRIWVFGNNAGIDFNDTSNPNSFTPSNWNYELSTSISDATGNLLIYLASRTTFDDTIFILNSNNQPLVNGTNVNTNSTLARGAVILPVPDRDNQYLILYTGFNSTNCNGNLCVNLYYSLVNMSISNGIITIKDSLLLNVKVEEGITAIKHANGRDWWLIGHIARENVNVPCTNQFYRFLIDSNGIHGPYYQFIGTDHCNAAYPTGEPNFSKEGSKFAYVTALEGIIDLFEFDRCAGMLFNHVNISDNNSSEGYSSEFSPDGEKLYVSVGFNVGGILDCNELLQYDLSSPDISSSKVSIWTDTCNPFITGQIELGADSKIYLAYGKATSGGSIVPSFFNKNISVIHSPNLNGALCDFRPFSFFLGDSSISSVSLPNMPNYNLGPIPLYQAEAAGKDTLVWCQNDTTLHSLQLGLAAVPGITYAWQPANALDDTTLAQPTTTTMKDQWYYVTITDTTDTISSCTQRVDSVFVQVMPQCFTSIEEPTQHDKTYRLHPNLIKGQMSGQITLEVAETGQLDVYSLQGKLITSYELNEGVNSLLLGNDDYSAGVYIYKVWVNGKTKNANKLVIVK